MPHKRLCFSAKYCKAYTLASQSTAASQLHFGLYTIVALYLCSSASRKGLEVEPWCIGDSQQVPYILKTTSTFNVKMLDIFLEERGSGSSYEALMLFDISL